MKKFFYVFIFFIYIINSQDCNDNEFVLGDNGESWFKVNNSYCECTSFIGDGSKLTNLVKNEIVIDLQKKNYNIRKQNK